jgi:hypothetical protein
VLDSDGRERARRCAVVCVVLGIDADVEGRAGACVVGTLEAGAGAAGVTSPAVCGARREPSGACCCPPTGAASGWICGEGSGLGGALALATPAHRQAMARAIPAAAATA